MYSKREFAILINFLNKGRLSESNIHKVNMN